MFSRAPLWRARPAWLGPRGPELPASFESDFSAFLMKPAANLLVNVVPTSHGLPP